MDHVSARNHHCYHYKYLLTSVWVYGYAGCREYYKDFTASLKTFDVQKMKQMYDRVITRKENASKDWNYIISKLLKSFSVCFVVVYACFMYINDLFDNCCFQPGAIEATSVYSKSSAPFSSYIAKKRVDRSGDPL